MSYICLKALSLGGMTYQPGEGIPDGAILPSRVRSLTSCGYIAAQGAEPAAEAEAPAGESAGGVLYVPIKGDDELTVPIPVDGAAFIFALQQSTADEAAAMLQDVEDENVLILTESHVAVHHRRNTDGSQLLDFAVVLSLHVLAEVSVAILQTFPDGVDAVSPEAINQLVFPLKATLCDRVVVGVNQDSLDSGRAKLDTENGLT